MSEETIKSEKNKLIRNYRIGSKHEVQRQFDIVEGISNEIIQRIPEKENETGVRDGRTRLVPNMLRCYFDDMYKVLDGAFGCLKTKEQ